MNGELGGLASVITVTDRMLSEFVILMLFLDLFNVLQRQLVP
jgi:hypothetical protein